MTPPQPTRLTKSVLLDDIHRFDPDVTSSMLLGSDEPGTEVLDWQWPDERSVPAARSSFRGDVASVLRARRHVAVVVVVLAVLAATVFVVISADGSRTRTAQVGEPAEQVVAGAPVSSQASPSPVAAGAAGRPLVVGDERRPAGSDTAAEGQAPTSEPVGSTSQAAIGADSKSTTAPDSANANSASQTMVEAGQTTSSRTSDLRRSIPASPDPTRADRNGTTARSTAATPTTGAAPTAMAGAPRRTTPTAGKPAMRANPPAPSSRPTTATTATADRTTTTTARATTTITTTARTTNPTTVATTQTTAAGGSPGQVIWEDDFSSFDTSVWRREHSTYGDGNNELQCYRPENVSVSNGRLILRAVTERYTCPNGSTRQVTSGMIRSSGVSFSPGQAIQFRVKLNPADSDDQGGLWPAVWASGWAGGGWPAGGEMDWLEVMTAENPNRAMFSVHYADPAGKHKLQNRGVIGSRNFSDSWHTVRFDYGYNGRLTWYLDGAEAFEVDAASTLQGFPAPFDGTIREIKINLALGGRPGPLAAGAVGSSGASFEVDYIRILKL